MICPNGTLIGLFIEASIPDFPKKGKQTTTKQPPPHPLHQKSKQTLTNTNKTQWKKHKVVSYQKYEVPYNLCSH